MPFLIPLLSTTLMMYILPVAGSKRRKKLLLYRERQTEEVRLKRKYILSLFYGEV